MTHNWLETANLPPQALRTIAAHIDNMLPQEAVGLLWEAPGTPVGMMLLPNRSEAPESSYAVDVADMMAEFERGQGHDMVTGLERGVHFTLWHSHPSGQVGPSRGDMREKQLGLTYMVIAVTDEGLRATLF